MDGGNCTLVRRNAVETAQIVLENGPRKNRLRAKGYYSVHSSGKSIKRSPSRTGQRGPTTGTVKVPQDGHNCIESGEYGRGKKLRVVKLKPESSVT